MKQAAERLKQAVGAGIFLTDEPMSRHTTFRTGGPADIYIEPSGVEELKQVLDICREENVAYTIIGNGSNLLVGYFDQQSALIDSDKTVRDHFHELFPALLEKDLRKTLGMYLFGGANASKRISSLSGGEKSRLVLAELLTGRPNLMILDEPTNHMDIPAKETLESAFKAYTGTMLFVSHDRYFIKQVADAILVFENDKVMYYPFGYDHYISRLKASQDGNLPALMQAKDAAMVEALAAVPKRERHETRQLSTEEAYLEWKLALAAEPVVKAAEEAEKVYEELCEAESELNEENVDKLRLQYEKVADSWTNECTKWYDIYLDEMYPESDF